MSSAKRRIANGLMTAHSELQRFLNDLKNLKYVTVAVDSSTSARAEVSTCAGVDFGVVEYQVVLIAATPS